MNNLLTICVLTHDRPEFFRECLNSILNQSYENFRLIVLHNPSDTNYPPMTPCLHDSRITYIKHPANIGIHANFRMAFTKFSDTKYLVVFHDDDIMHPKLIESQLEIMERQPEINIIATEPIEFEQIQECARYSGIQKPGAVIYQSSGQFAKALLKGVRWHYGSTMYRSGALEKIDWDEITQQYSKIGDRALLLTLAQSGKAALLRERMVFYRHHSGQDSASMWDAEEPFINLYKLYRQSLEKNWNVESAFVFFRHTGFWLLWTYGKLDRQTRSPFLLFIKKCREAKIICIPFMLLYPTWKLKIRMAHFLKRILPTSLFDRFRAAVSGV